MSASPLAGFRIIDASRHLPGPLATQILSSLGAAVVKVEEPSKGDPLRLAPPRLGGHGALASMLLSGTRSIALDLKSRSGADVFLALLDEADVLVESFRPGTLERMGMGPRRLQDRFPRLVVCSVSGWGQTGPYSARSGHDLTYQAVAGTLGSTGRMPGVVTADVAGAWSAASSVLAALLERHKTGRGAWIDASLFDAAVHANVIGVAAEAGPEPNRAVSQPHDFAGAMAGYRLYSTADDGRLAIACLEAHFWERFCELIGRQDLSGIHLRRDRASHRKVAEVVRGKSSVTWRRLLEGVDLPIELVESVAGAAQHPQLVARDLLRHGEEGAPRLAYPARFDGARPRAGGRVPKLGEDTEALLLELDHPLASTARRRRRSQGVGARGTWRRRFAEWLADRRFRDG